ncbi:choloylglycine hydrolase [Lactobacillus intestinalis]|uniref:choloylglycine hydrolase n=1 Tax=Lactobacillus intestinalis DSM 6629 TaxID=1423761 RepID=A0ABR5PNI1_9LACO|nr:choloylglycine hydrolase [Lactobacillus intestinalis]KRM31355.1 conjugated bile salt hydrolase [Lactobacillus intestinalis DSM 6629]UTW40091.1 choloylglycine hydrolase [Lactobacillus intestinalis]
MCTGLRFTDDQGNLYFGRNLDVGQDYGEKVIVTPRNYPLPYKFLADTKTSKAVIGMGIVVDGYPSYFDCFNEDGLGIAGLNFPHYAQFSKEPVNGKINLASYEIMLWVTQNFTTVKEVKEALKNVNLVSEAINSDFAVAPLHWIISDNEEAIVVEVSKQYGMKVFEDKLGVLTNSPDFNWQVTNLGNYTGLSPHDATLQNWNGQEVMPWGVGTGSLGLPGDSIPASRFAKVAYLNANYPTQKGETANVAKFFNILKSVAMVKGSVINNQGKDEYTVYTACYSSKTKTYYCNYATDFELKKYTITDENLSLNKLTIY